MCEPLGMHRRPRTTAALAPLLVAALALTGVACSEDDDGGDDRQAFCDAVHARDDVPESYVGSPEHVRDLDDVLAVAPDDIRPDVQTFRDFLAEGGISPDDPESNLVENFPPEVREATEAVRTYTEEHC